MRVAAEQRPASRRVKGYPWSEARFRLNRRGNDTKTMTFADVSRMAARLDGVAEHRRDGLLDWRYRGRLVARQLDDSRIVVRASFDFRDFLLHAFPETFSVPRRYTKHMMIVADLENGNG